MGGMERVRRCIPLGPSVPEHSGPGQGAWLRSGGSRGGSILPPSSPASRPSPRPARSPLLPSRLLPGHLPLLLPRRFAGALAARRAPGGGGGTVRGPGAQDSGPGAKVCQQPRQAKRVPRAACCPISHPHPGNAAPGDRAAARLAPRRGRRDGNLRWELRGLQPSGTLLLQAVLRALHVAAALVPSADTLEPRRGRRGDAGCTHAGAVWSGHGSSPGVPGMRSAL